VKRWIVSCIVPSSILFLLAGCGIKTPTTQSDAQSTIDAAKTWNCSSEKDGIGENYVCHTNGSDATGTSWILTIACTSSLDTHHAILAFKEDASVSKVIWSVNSTPSVNTRLDEGPISDWNIGTINGGTGFIFTEPTQNWNSATWNFLTRIAGAKKLGIKGYDQNGEVQSTSFPVEGSVMIAAKFNTLGCKSSK